MQITTVGPDPSVNPFHHTLAMLPQGLATVLHNIGSKSGTSGFTPGLRVQIDTRTPAHVEVSCVEPDSSSTPE